MACSEVSSSHTEEIKALSAIYGTDLQIIDGEENALELKISCDEEGWWAATVCALLPLTYPDFEAPILEIHTECLSGKELELMEAELQNIWVKANGEIILYVWFEKIREMLLDKYETAKLFIEASPDERARESYITDSFRNESDALSTTIIASVSTNACPDIYSGEPLTVKKSTFQGHVAQVFTTDEVKLVLHKLQENNKIANATHNIVAFRLSGVNEASFIQDFADDGELNAGGKLLHLLQILDLKNIVVVVSRWFGGVLLGPDRFRLINNTAREVIIAAGFFNSETSKVKQRKKLSGKNKKL